MIDDPKSARQFLEDNQRMTSRGSMENIQWGDGKLESEPQFI